MLSWIELDSARFRGNIDAFRKIAKPGTSVMVVIKANADGHCLRGLAPAAADAGDWLGVNSVEEAREITALGIQKPIAILGYSEAVHAVTIVDNEYRQVVYRLDVAKALSLAAQKTGRAA